LYFSIFGLKTDQTDVGLQANGPMRTFNCNKENLTGTAYIAMYAYSAKWHCNRRHLRSTAFRRRRRHFVRSEAPPSHRASFYRRIRRHGRKTCNVKA